MYRLYELYKENLKQISKIEELSNFIHYIEIDKMFCTKNKDYISLPWSHIQNNEFLNYYAHQKEQLALTCIKKGMLFPFVGFEDKEKVEIIEGRHRLASFKILLELDYIKKDYKLPVILLNDIKFSNPLSLPLYTINKELKIDIVIVNKYTDLLSIMKNWGKVLGQLLFDYQDNIIPAFELNEKNN